MGVSGRVALLIAVAAAVGLLAPQVLGSYPLFLLTQMLIYSIAAMSLDLLIGYTGLVSLAHAALFGASAYAVGIAQVHYGISNYSLLLLLGIATAVALAGTFALVALRGRGPTFIIITVALSQIVWGLAQQWTSVTGGDNGLMGFRRPAFGSLSFAEDVPFYYLTLVVFAVCTVLLVAIVRSPFGLALQGVREEPRRMGALGYNVWLYSFLAFLIGGFFAGVSGAFYAWHNLFVSPFAVSAVTSIQMLMMVVVGGRATLGGPVLGAAIVVFLSNFLMQVTYRWEFVLGVIYILVVLYMPEGLVGLAKRLYRPGRKDRAGSGSPSAL